MIIYLIRHGKTSANEKHLYCGSTDLPLSDAGKAELQRLHYDIKNVRFITSGMKRTNETLQILFGDIPYKVDPRFREVDFGIFEIHSYEKLKDNPDYQAWLTGDNETNIPYADKIIMPTLAILFRLAICLPRKCRHFLF